MITDKNGHVEENSGFNAFNGASKLAKKDRLPRIKRFKTEFETVLSREDLNYIVNALTLILLKSWSTKEDKAKMKVIRQELVDFVHQLDNDVLIDKIEKMVYRPVGEVYIPIPDSVHFHNEHSNFFGEGVGTFEKGSKKLFSPKENRVFPLKFLASGDVIDAYINQEGGKAIQSVDKQDILGEWLLRGVFQLKERELLTGDKLDALGINGIRLSKFNNGEIGISFIWIDSTNPPEDAIGWVSKLRKEIL